MNNSLQLITLFSIIMLSACASQTNWTPTVDPYGDPNNARINQDMYECRQLALQASSGTGAETAKGAGIGALGGAATGAIIGAIAGNAGTGAAIGAVAGGVGGGTRQALSSDQIYKRSYSNCLRNRGHYVVN